MVFYVTLQASGEFLRKHQKYQVLTAAPLIDYPQSISQPANIFTDGAQLNNLFSFTPLTLIFPQHPMMLVTNIIPILHMEKLGHQKLRHFTKLT